jgi:hypothetical protein
MHLFAVLSHAPLFTLALSAAVANSFPPSADITSNATATIGRESSVAMALPIHNAEKPTWESTLQHSLLPAPYFLLVLLLLLQRRSHNQD